MWKFQSGSHLIVQHCKTVVSSWWLWVLWSPVMCLQVSSCFFSTLSIPQSQEEQPAFFHFTGAGGVSKDHKRHCLWGFRERLFKTAASLVGVSQA